MLNETMTLMICRRLRDVLSNISKVNNEKFNLKLNSYHIISWVPYLPYN